MNDLKRKLEKIQNDKKFAQKNTKVVIPQDKYVLGDYLTYPDWLREQIWKERNDKVKNI